METKQLSRLKTWKVVDARGEPCSCHLLEPKAAIQQIPIGEVLKVHLSDPDATRDIQAWARKAGHEYLGCVPKSDCKILFLTRRK